MIPYDHDWEYGDSRRFCYDDTLEYRKPRKKRRKVREPVVALYDKTQLVEQHDAILGDGCQSIIVE